MSVMLASSLRESMASTDNPGTRLIPVKACRIAGARTSIENHRHQS
jgi:hypothetical protein